MLYDCWSGPEWLQSKSTEKADVKYITQIVQHICISVVCILQALSHSHTQDRKQCTLVLVNSQINMIVNFNNMYRENENGGGCLVVLEFSLN